MVTDQLVVIKEEIVNACADLLPVFGIEHRFLCELGESSLNSSEKINIIIGLTNGVKGNIIIGLTKESAKKIISGLRGGKQIDELKKKELKTLGEFANMLSSKIIVKLSDRLGKEVNTSLPTIVTGVDTFLLISRAPSRKAFFKLQESKFNIAYCIEIDK